MVFPDYQNFKIFSNNCNYVLLFCNLGYNFSLLVLFSHKPSLLNHPDYTSALPYFLSNSYQQTHVDGEVGDDAPQQTEEGVFEE